MLEYVIAPVVQDLANKTLSSSFEIDSAKAGSKQASLAKAQQNLQLLVQQILDRIFASHVQTTSYAHLSRDPFSSLYFCLLRFNACFLHNEKWYYEALCTYISNSKGAHACTRV